MDARAYLDHVAAILDPYLRTLSDERLHVLRNALTVDRAHGGDPEFIGARIAAIDAILRERGGVSESS